MDKAVVTPRFLVPLSDAWFEWRIGSARQGAANTAIDSRPFINCVRDLKRHKAWETYFKDGAKTWERFCRELLDTEPEFVDQIELGVEVLEDAGHFGPIPERQAIDAAKRVKATAIEAKPQRTSKAAMTGNSNANKSFTTKNSFDIIKTVSDSKVNNINTAVSKTTKGGTDPEYLTARIARDRPDIHERMKAGEYKSVRRAAIDAGIIREPTTLEKAQKLWQKMTAKERAAFKQWLKDN